MKGSEKVIEALNARLSDELAAVGPYIVHSEMCDSRGCGKLHQPSKNGPSRR